MKPEELALPKLEPAADTLELARRIMAHRIPLFDTEIEAGPEIEWRRDYVHGKTSGTDYFRFIPYLDFSRVGDHKNIWELSRHQHLVVLAQAQILTGDAGFGREIQRQLGSWWEQNPFLRGMNWASALEVAFRALSWLWVDHLIGPSFGPDFQRRIWRSLYEHGAYLECNFSTYFSPNTHLLGEAAALHAIGVRLNHERWRKLGAKTVAGELARQVQADGSHFEQSTYYHVYALDLFLLHYQLAGRPWEFEPVLRKMAGFLASIVGPDELLTCFGDDDGGRLFHAYGPRNEFARATLSHCEGLLGAGEARTAWFPQSGLASIIHGNRHVLMDAGGFGFGGAGHSHADTLSISARAGVRELLIDPGTFTYVADAKLRDAFRGTGFHNTIRIDELDQARPVGPFRWEEKPEVRVHQWLAEDGYALLDASCLYRGFEHRRRLFVVGGEALFVLDEVTGPEGLHLVEQIWHLGDEDVAILFSDPGAVRRETGLRSRVLGSKEPTPVRRAVWRTELPHRCAAAVSFERFETGDQLKLNGMEISIPGKMTVSFEGSGMAKVRRA